MARLRSKFVRCVGGCVWKAFRHACIAVCPGLAACGLLSARLRRRSGRGARRCGRHDVGTGGRADGRGYFKDVDRTLALKIKVKNVSFKPLPAGKLEWNVYVKRWGGFEVEQIERLSGTLDLPELVVARELELSGGEFQIGGHLHGSSKIHLDEVEGWKVVLTHEGKVRSLVSSSAVPTLDKRSQRRLGNRVGSP